LPGKEKPVDRWLAAAFGVVSIVMYLIPDKTPSVILICLVILFLLAVHPVWNFWWIEKYIWRRLAALVFTCGALVYLGYRSWPRPPEVLEITPPHVVFGRPIGRPMDDEAYVFRIANNSDRKVYSAEFDFIVDELTASVKEISIDIPKEYRKPFGEGGSGAEHFTDLIGCRCRTPTQHLLYALSFRSLDPHEARELKLIHTRRGKLGVSAKTGFFSLDQQPIQIKGDEISSWFRVDAPNDGTGCSFFSFLVDKQEMYWFGGKP